MKMFGPWYVNQENRENPDEVFKTVIGEPILEKDLWSCTTCMACVEQWPVMIDSLENFVRVIPVFPVFFTLRHNSFPDIPDDISR